jgi:hypothetical protein
VRGGGEKGVIYIDRLKYMLVSPSIFRSSSLNAFARAGAKRECCDKASTTFRRAMYIYINVLDKLLLYHLWYLCEAIISIHMHHSYIPHDGQQCPKKSRCEGARR